MSNHYTPAPKHMLHSSFGHPLLKSWNTEERVEADNIVYPVFIVEGENVQQEIKSLPGQYRWSVDTLPKLLDPLVKLGLRSVILFGVIENENLKDASGSVATDANVSPVIRALKLLREKYPSLFLMVDLCLCGYSDHGHCGIVHENGAINNQPSIERLSEIAVAFADAGAQCISPSDMMDGRIGAIKHALKQAGYGSTVPVMSYSAKFASCFYGPFRDAAGSGAKFGNRGNYQLPPGSRGLAIRAIERDIEEGADFVMVKPGMPYLDVVRDCANIASQRGIPVAIYHVSGEYAMLYHGAAAGAFDLTEAIMESMLSMRRAGASVILTYFAKEILEFLEKN